MWDISSGELLCKFVFDVSIMSVTMDTAEFQMFVGGSNGVIYSVNLFEMVGLHYLTTYVNFLTMKILIMCS